MAEESERAKRTFLYQTVDPDYFVWIDDTPPTVEEFEEAKRQLLTGGGLVPSQLLAVEASKFPENPIVSKACADVLEQVEETRYRKRLPLSVTEAERVFSDYKELIRELGKEDV
jgi:hypothetical protein